MSSAERKRVLDAYNQLTQVQKNSVAKRVRTLLGAPSGQVPSMIQGGAQLAKISEIVDDHLKKKNLRSVIQGGAPRTTTTRMFQFLSPSGMKSVLSAGKTPHKVFHQSVAPAMETLPTLQFRNPDGLVQKIHLFRSLETLDLNSRALRGKSVTVLTNAFPHLVELRVLDLSGSHILFTRPVSPFLCESIGSLKKLEVLRLTSCKFTKDSIISLSSSFHRLHKLTELHMDGCDLNDELASELAGGIAHLVSLRVLDMLPNNIGDMGSKHLAGAISLLQNLREVDIGNNVGDEGADHLFKSLKNHNKMETILLGNGIGDAGMSSFASVAPNLSDLDLLSLGNQITSRGAEILASVLRYMPNIRVLEMQNNNITDKGVEYLCNAFRSPSLVTLDLSNNGISAAGIRHLVAAAPHIQNLGYLLIQENRDIRDEGVRLIADNLDRFPSLVELNISATRVRDAGVRSIAVALLPRLDRFQTLHLSTTGLRRAVDGAVWLLGSDKVVFH